MKKLFFIAIVVVLISTIPLSGCVAIRVIGQNLFRRYEPIEFSKEEWATNPDDRGRMTDDLLEKYDFTTMTKDDVIELLGEENIHISEDTLVYETGGGFFQDERLVFIFDESGNIIDVGIAN